MQLILVLLSFIFIPYIIATIMPNWKWLAVYGILFLVIYTWLSKDYGSFKHNRDDNFGSQFVPMYLNLMLIGTLCGMVPTAIGFILKKKGKSTRTVKLVSYSGLIPVIGYIVSLLF